MVEDITREEAAQSNYYVYQPKDVDHYPELIQYKGNFRRYVYQLIDMEGGYSLGGHDVETKYGITENTYDSFLEEYPHEKIKGWPEYLKDITPEHAARIYFDEYWVKPEICVLPPEYAFHTFVAGVNIGTLKAIKFMQRALGVKEDGIIGDKTYSAAWDAFSGKNKGSVVCSFCNTLLHYYASLSKSKYFYKGWFNRVINTTRLGGI